MDIDEVVGLLGEIGKRDHGGWSGVKQLTHWLRTEVGQANMIGYLGLRQYPGGEVGAQHCWQSAVYRAGLAAEQGAGLKRRAVVTATALYDRVSREMQVPVPLPFDTGLVLTRPMVGEMVRLTWRPLPTMQPIPRVPMVGGLSAGTVDVMLAYGSIGEVLRDGWLLEHGSWSSIGGPIGDWRKMVEAVVMVIAHDREHRARIATEDVRVLVVDGQTRAIDDTPGMAVLHATLMHVVEHIVRGRTLMRLGNSETRDAELTRMVEREAPRGELLRWWTRQHTKREVALLDEREDALGEILIGGLWGGVEFGEVIRRIDEIADIGAELDREAQRRYERRRERARVQPRDRGRFVKVMN